MTKWTVEITDKAKEELKNLLAKKDVSTSDVKVLLRWVDEMEEFGPNFIAQSKE